MGFVADIGKRWTDANTLVCVGLDPEPAKFPPQLRDDPLDPISPYGRQLVAERLRHTR